VRAHTLGANLGGAPRSKGQARPTKTRNRNPFQPRRLCRSARRAESPEPKAQASSDLLLPYPGSGLALRKQRKISTLRFAPGWFPLVTVTKDWKFLIWG